MSDPNATETTASPLRPTGPRTRDGRVRSRRNARIHGLTAALPDGDAEAALMRQFADHWADQLGPETPAEEALIRNSAIAYARLERCRTVEEATLRTAAQDAVDRWQERRRHASRRKGQDLGRDPSNTVADLESSSFGCEWLLRHWLRLDARLAQGIGWDRQDLILFMNLLGLLPQAPGPDADPDIRRDWHLARVASGYPIDPEPGLPSDPMPARLDLRRRVAAEIDRLESLRNDLWARQDGPTAEAVAQAGLIDTSKEGQLRHRYRREAFSEMVRGINQAMRLHAERRKDAAHRPRLDAPSTVPDALVPSPSPAEATPPPPAVAPPPANLACHRNEPPREAAESPVACRNPNDSGDLRDDAAEPSGEPCRRTGPFPAAPRRPDEALPVGVPALSIGEDGPRSAPMAAVLAG